MKNKPIDQFAAKDIQNQVDKILKGLGNPDPPLDLRDVRELLKLDKKFYSTTNTGALQEFASKIKIGAKQLAQRPTLIIDIVKKAGLKALWLPDKKRILIDEDIPDLKKRHAEAHEITHSITPHHGLYLFGDNDETLRRTCHEKLEGEANYGSGQLLFLREKFIQEANDLQRTLKTVQSLAKSFGNTITMTLWRLVEEAHKDEAIFGIVSVHPQYLSEDFDPKYPCRHFIESPNFRSRFGQLSEIDVFKAIKSYTSWSKGGSLGEGIVVFNDCNNDQHLFHMETFYNRHEALTLGKHLGPVKSTITVF